MTAPVPLPDITVPVQGGPAAPSHAQSHGNQAYTAPIVVSPPLNVANEILGMLGSQENGGAFESQPSRLASVLSGGGAGGAFKVDLGGVEGKVSAGTLAIGGVVLAGLVALAVFWRR